MEISHLKVKIICNITKYTCCMCLPLLSRYYEYWTLSIHNCHFMAASQIAWHTNKYVNIACHNLLPQLFTHLLFRNSSGWILSGSLWIQNQSWEHWSCGRNTAWMGHQSILINPQGQFSVDNRSKACLSSLGGNSRTRGNQDSDITCTTPHIITQPNVAEATLK